MQASFKFNFFNHPLIRTQKVGIPVLLLTCLLTACLQPAQNTECESADNCFENELCIENQCQLCLDNDNDGYFGTGSGCIVMEEIDCDDNDPEIHPAAEENCDGVDNNCDGDIDIFACPLQQGVCKGLMADCDENCNYRIWAEQEYGVTYTEQENENFSDSQDNDCDGEIDEIACGPTNAQCPQGINCNDNEMEECCGGSFCASPMISIPGRDYLMGCDPAQEYLCPDEELPQRLVKIPAFAIDVSEVTTGQFFSFMEANNQHIGEVTLLCNMGNPERSRHPMNCISWSDARDYCNWTGKRLCTEAEWERAAKGENDLLYPWGNIDPNCNRAQMKDCSTRTPHTTEVYNLEAGASPYGVLHMAGNLAEWVQDGWHDNYEGAPSDGSAWSGGTTRVLRGGYYGSDSEDLRTTARATKTVTSIGPGASVGFRCCRDLSRQ